MVQLRTMMLCPACSCHARQGEVECPHCGAALTRAPGTATPRSVAALAVGLALAVALPIAACGDDTGGGGGNGGGGSGGAAATDGASTATTDDASSSSADSSVVSTYGVAVSSNASSGSDGGAQ